MAAPLDFGVGADDSLVQVWSDPKYFDVDALIDAFGNCPATFLQASFQMMKPVQNYVTKYITFYDKMDDEKFVENYVAMEKWTNDNIPVAGETFREFVKKLYQRNELVKGEFRLGVGEEPVQLKRITCPLHAALGHRRPPGAAGADGGFARLCRVDGYEGRQARRRPHRPGGQLEGPQAVLARGDRMARRAIVSAPIRRAFLTFPIQYLGFDQGRETLPCLRPCLVRDNGRKLEVCSRTEPPDPFHGGLGGSDLRLSRRCAAHCRGNSGMPATGSSKPRR